MSPKKQELDVFLQLVQSSLWQEPSIVIPCDGIRWEVIWQLAYEQTVEVLVATAIKRLPDNVMLLACQPQDPDEVICTSWMQHKRLNKKLHQVFDFLRQKNFAPVLLKGQGNAARYADPVMRQCGDIDVYIGPRDFERACQCIGQLVGYDAVGICRVSNKHMHLNLSDNDILELHRIAERMHMPWLDDHFQQMSAEQLLPANIERVSIGGHDIEVPPRSFNVLYVFNHLWHHLMLGGIGLRQLCDWCILLHEAYGTLDLPWLEAELRHLHLIRGWKIMGRIAVTRLGLSTTEMPFYTERYDAQSNLVWQQIMEGGNFGRHGGERNTYDRDKQYVLRKVKTFKIISRRFINNWRISPFDAFWTYFYFLNLGAKLVLKDLKRFIQRWRRETLK